MKLARLIAFLTHPFLVPVLAIFILFQAGTWLSLLSPDAKRYVYLVTLTCSGLLPFFTVLIMKNKAYISDWLMDGTKERRIPLMLFSFFTLIGAFILQKVSAPMVFPIYLNGLSIALLVAALISGYWKISIHMLSFGALVGLILAVAIKWSVDLRLVLAGILLLTGLLGSAHLYRQSHSIGQLAAGFCLGFLGVFFIVRLI